MILLKTLSVLSLVFFFATQTLAKPQSVLFVPSLSQWETTEASLPFLHSHWLKQLKEQLGSEYSKIDPSKPLWVLWCLKEDSPFNPNLAFLLPCPSIENPSLVSKKIKDALAIASNPLDLQEAELFYTKPHPTPVLSSTHACAFVDVPSYWNRYRSTAQMLRGLFSMSVSDVPELRKLCNQGFEFIFWILDSLQSLTVSMPLGPTSSVLHCSLELEFTRNSIFKTLFPKVTQTLLSCETSKDLSSQIRIAFDPRLWKKFLLQFAQRLQQNNLSNPEETQAFQQSIHRILNAFPARSLIFDAVTYKDLGPNSGVSAGGLRFVTPDASVTLPEIKKIAETMFLHSVIHCLTTWDDLPPKPQALTVTLKPQQNSLNLEVPIFILEWINLFFSKKSELAFYFFQKNQSVLGTLGEGNKKELLREGDKSTQEIPLPFFEILLEPSTFKLLFPAAPFQPPAQNEVPLSLDAFATDSGVRLEIQMPKSILEKSSHSKT